MTKNFALAASVAMLVALSGQALAGTTAPKVRHQPQATGTSDRQMARAFTASDAMMTAPTAEPNAHRYHGGPKSND